MPKVRSGIDEKWVRRSSSATQEYTQGVQNPRQPWAASTVAAEGNYGAGVTAAVTNKRFSKGVTKVGDAKWQGKSVTVGSGRFAGGVQAGLADYASGVAPYTATIEATQLPPRGPKGDPRNLQRVSAIATALRAKKLSMP